MKKFLGLILILVCFITPAFADTVSQEILDQAKAQAGLFMDLKNALGLEWLDEYNAYLTNPTSSPEPSWASSVTELINKNYLSTAFPTDFTITPTGQEVTISRIITSQGIKDALPIYLPAVTISGDTVSLLVQRPAQWVAWEDALASKVSRAGDDNPDILPGASLEFGSGSKIEFINNDGKLVGINSLTYKGQELEDRFVNAAGDNMTGPLKINGNIVWHAGNDGSGSGLDADLLDGRSGSFYQNADNLNAGIVPTARLSGTYNISISGNAATATNANYASSAGNADTVDGKHASDFALSGHTHGYVLKAGDTMIGPLGVNFENGITSGIGSHNIKGIGSTDVVGKGFKINWDTDFGFVGLVDKGADRKDMVFANEQTGDNFVFMSQGMEIMALKPASKTLEIDGNKVWHAGNDGSGSGLDADKVDGYSSEKFLAARGNGTISSKGRVWTVGEFLSLPPGTYMVDQNISASEFGCPVPNGSNDKLFNLIIFPPNSNSRGNAILIYRSGESFLFNKHSGYPTDIMNSSYWQDLGGKDAIVAQSLGTNGYVKFNTGLIIQWGRLPRVRWNTPTTGNFTIPFPNACLSVQATHGTSVGHTYAIGIWILSKSQFCVRAGDIDTHIYYPVYWLAIGY